MADVQIIFSSLRSNNAGDGTLVHCGEWSQKSSYGYCNEREIEWDCYYEHKDLRLKTFHQLHLYWCYRNIFCWVSINMVDGFIGNEHINIKFACTLARVERLDGIEAFQTTTFMTEMIGIAQDILIGLYDVSRLSCDNIIMLSVHRKAAFVESSGHMTSNWVLHIWWITVALQWNDMLYVWSIEAFFMKEELNDWMG